MSQQMHFLDIHIQHGINAHVKTTRETKCNGVHLAATRDT